jgi:hypothetical protein
MAREKSMTDLKTSKARLNLLFHANEAGDFNVKPMLNLNYICNFKYTIAFKIILNILCSKNGTTRPRRQCIYLSYNLLNTFKPLLRIAAQIKNNSFQNMTAHDSVPQQPRWKSVMKLVLFSFLLK